MSEPTQKMGTGMIVASWVIIITMLTLAFSGFLDNKYNPNQNVETYQNTTTGQREVILQRGHHGHYVATGTINGTAVTFLLDTGATDIAIPEHIAKKIGLKRGMPMQVSTANGSITVYSSRLNSVTLGLIELNNVRANINPYMDGDEVLLGMSFLKHLEMVQKGEVLILRL
ncbi:TIGR02281 family clan AA aspartic protease [Candidatus Albibeggiatoa sp. nov. NOAA]|uniref:retropepsin-like aspartic protease family protein n=1 Tax=Candidatus Albibeggiatoa sp. nov. NOAA TaxID=3162724 RepID=UPI0033042120|nr:TIGR02281 family clan AA aspartic protease [Thiotrichaceae bacterium]